MIQMTESSAPAASEIGLDRAHSLRRKWHPEALPAPEVLRQAVAEHGSPVLLLSPKRAASQYRRIAKALPGVDIHYAMKALPNPDLIDALESEGAFFDVCSNGEIDLLANAGIDPLRCIHSHPIKKLRDVRHGLEFGCDTYVFDNLYELDKLEPVKGDIKLLLRLSFRSPDAVVDLSYKFGAAPEQALGILATARNRGFTVTGLCFHVGSQSLSPDKHVEAIVACRALFDLAASAGMQLDTLDIGGGFPVPYTEPVMDIEEFCRPIMAELDEHFASTRIIAEPGRFIAAPPMTLISSVIGKSEREGRMWYYLDDGLYSSYSGRLFDHCDYTVTPLRILEGDRSERRQSVLAGPTCDSIDVIYEDQSIPELDPGDLLVSPMMGAYTCASATEFNHFSKTSIVAVD